MTIYAKTYARAKASIEALGDPVWQELDTMDVAMVHGFPDEDLALAVTCGLSQFRLEFELPNEAIAFELSLVIPQRFATVDFSGVLADASDLLLDRYLGNGCTPPRNAVWPLPALSVMSKTMNWRLSSSLFGYGIFAPTDSAMVHDDELGTLCIAELVLLTDDEARLASEDVRAFTDAAASGQVNLLEFSR